MVYLSLGSNLGDRYRFLKLGLDRLQKLAIDGKIRCSSIYETEPWGLVEQPNFLNCAVELECSISPESLLSEIHEIEINAGRIRGDKSKTVRWGARTLDIDILIFDSRIIDSEILTVPHRRITGRKFVLVPLSELVPNLPVPGYGKTVQQIRDECQDKSKLDLWENEKHAFDKYPEMKD